MKLFPVKFEPDLLKRIRAAAKKANISAAQYIRNACRAQLERDTFTWQDKQSKAVQE